MPSILKAIPDKDCHHSCIGGPVPAMGPVPEFVPMGPVPGVVSVGPVLRVVPEPVLDFPPRPLFMRMLVKSM